MAGAEIETAFRFERFRLDLVRGSLNDDVGEVELRPKCFDMLRFLVGNAGRLVSKTDLMEAVWPDVIVTDESLSRCVSDLRLALGDGEQTMLRTIRGRGYLFASPVLAEREPAGPPTASAPRVERPPFTDLALPLIRKVIEATETHGDAYEGFYRSTRPYAAAPGAFIHDSIMVRMEPDGVLRVNMLTGGVRVAGWLLPVQTQIYVVGTESIGGGLVFAILHGVDGPRVDALDGITLTSTLDFGRTPAAAAVIYERIGVLSGDREADDAHLEAMGAGNPVAPPGSVPEDLRRHLTRDLGPEQPGAILDGVLKLPVAGSRSSGGASVATGQFKSDPDELA